MIIDRIKENNIPINKDIIEGIPRLMLQEIEQYIRVMFTSIFDTGPEELKFLGIEMAKPWEAYLERTKVRSGRKMNVRDNKNTKIAPSKGFPIEDKNFYMIKVSISWDNEKIDTIKIFIPFLDQDGLIKINGSVFSLSPVLSDKNISVDKNNIFCPIELREKLTFRKVSHNLYKNGAFYTSTIAHENIYRGKKDSGKNASLKQILPYFLFAKYGMIGAFKRYLDTDIVTGMGDEINTTDFPIKIWDIYESTKHKPTKFSKPGAYYGTDLKIAIRRKDITKNFLLNQMIGGVYYLADRYPEKIELKHLDNTQLWRQLFAYIIKDKNSTLEVMLEQADRNIRSIDTYLDPITKSMFHRNGVDVDNFYDLLAYIGEVFVTKMRSDNSTTNYYEKRLVLLKHIVEPLVCRVNDFVYTVNRTKANKPDKKILPKVIRKLVATRIYSTTLESINNKNSCINSFSTSSDNMLFDLQTLVVSQSDHNRPKNKNKPNPLDDPSKKISASMLEVLSPLGATKSEPSGTNRLNCFVDIDTEKDFSIKKRESLYKIIEDVTIAIS